MLSEDESAFRAAVFAAPEDDAPRLIYADWLDEQGRHTDAEFIRVQCTLARIAETDPRRAELEDREFSLLRDNEPYWLGPGMQDAIQEWTFRRGFLDHVTVNVQTFLHRFDWFQAHPIRSLELHADTPAAVIPTAELAALDWPATLCELDVSHCEPENPYFWSQTIRSKLGSRLTGLTTFTPFWRLEPIGAADFPRLERLSLGLADFDARDFDAARTFLIRDRLKTLELIFCEGTNFAMELFGRGPAWSALETLQMDDEFPLEVLLAETLPVLKRLHCAEIECGEPTWRRIVASSFWQRVEELRLPGLRLSRTGCLDLIAEPPPRLRLLDLSNVSCGEDEWELLVREGRFPNLVWLSLASTAVRPSVLEGMAKSATNWAHLRSLHLGGNSALTPDSILSVLRSPIGRQLRLLHLGDLRLGDRFVQALTELTGEVSLSSLSLRSCRVNRESVGALAGSPMLGRLEWLDLSCNPSLRDKDLLPLVESPYLHPYLELDVTGLELHESVRDGLRERLGRRFSS